MDPAVALVCTYLNLNGYFTVTEIPVIRRGEDGAFYEVTDLDILALRLPGTAHIVAEGRPGLKDDLHFPLDPELEIARDRMDVIIGEVKAGKPRLNPALRDRDTLDRAVMRFGFCPPESLDRLVELLQRRGEALLGEEEGVSPPVRVRLVAFGDGSEGGRGGYTVVSLQRAAEFVLDHLRRHRQVLHPVRVSDPVLGLLHLLDKLHEDVGG